MSEHLIAFHKVVDLDKVPKKVSGLHQISRKPMTYMSTFSTHFHLVCRMLTFSDGTGGRDCRCPRMMKTKKLGDDEDIGGEKLICE